MADLLLFIAPGVTFTGSVPSGTDHDRLPTNATHELHGGISRLRIGSIDRETSGELLLGGQAETDSVGLGKASADVNVHGFLTVPASAWNGPHIKHVVGANTWHFWVDATGTLRSKNGAPSSDTDGSVVGGADVSTLVFRPGGTAANNVFITWDTLYTKIQSLDGPIKLQIDDSLATTTISGALAPYDLSRLTIVGQDPSTTAILSVLNVAAVLSGLPECVGPGVALLNTMVGTAAFTSSGGDRMFLDQWCVVSGSATAPFIDITGGTLTILAGGSLGNTNESVNIGAAGTLDLFALDGGSALVGSVSSAVGGTYNATHLSTSAIIDDQSGHAPFMGTFNRTLDNLSILEFYDNSTSGLTASTVKDAIDEIVVQLSASSVPAHTNFLYPENKIWMPSFNFEFENNITDSGPAGKGGTLTGSTPPTFDNVEKKVGSYSLLLNGGVASPNQGRLALGITDLILLDDSKSWTFMFWFKSPTPTNGISFIVKWGSGNTWQAGSREIALNTSGQLVWNRFGDVSVVLKSGVDDDVWHHCAIKYDKTDPFTASDVISVVLDGAAATTHTVGLSGPVSGDVCDIGVADTVIDWNLDSIVYYHYAAHDEHISAHETGSTVITSDMGVL